MTLKDQAGSPINLGTLAGMVVTLIQDDVGVVEKYSVNSSSGYEPIHITNASAGQFYVIIRRTLTLLDKTLFVQIKTRVADLQYPNGMRIAMTDRIPIDILKQTPSANVAVP